MNSVLRGFLCLIILTSIPFNVAFAKENLRANEKLTPGQFLKNGPYKLILQADGNLVLYDSGKALWSSKTAGVAVREAIMQSDGNFVLYKHNNKPVWNSGTHGKRGSYLSLQADGNVVIYYDPPPKAVWNSGTHR